MRQTLWQAQCDTFNNQNLILRCQAELVEASIKTKIKCELENSRIQKINH